MRLQCLYHILTISMNVTKTFCIFTPDSIATSIILRSSLKTDWGMAFLIVGHTYEGMCIKFIDMSSIFSLVSVPPNMQISEVNISVSKGDNVFFTEDLTNIILDFNNTTH